MTNASDPIMTAQQAWQRAKSCRQIGDDAGEIAALHGVLRHAHRDLGALLAMGEAFARQMDERAAMAWFRTALVQATAAPPPPQLTPLLRRAESYCATAQARFAEHLDAELAGIGLCGSAGSAFGHALALLKGETQLYLQQPSMFYYPGLPQRTFYERKEFAWIPDFEEQAEIFRTEYCSLLKAGEPFAAYVERPHARPAPNSPLLEDSSWGAAFLWRDGAATDLASQAPLTMAALTHVDAPVIPGRSPMALYSRLTSGTHIRPHHGLTNTRLICHLPLISPEGCALRVGHETREWQFGKMLIFDDSMEHEAWNRGSSERTVLLFEIWRPEIPEEDRAKITQLFAAIDRVDPAHGREGTE